MKVLLLLLLSAAATNAHFVVDCIASSHNTLTSIYASHGGTDNSTIARCLPNDHLVEFTTSVKSDQYDVAMPSCTDLDAERNPMLVYPGQTIFYSYVGIPLEGTGVVVDSAEATIVGVNTSSIIFDEDSTPTLTDFSKLPSEHAVTQGCDNNSTICSGAISFPVDISLGSLNITIAWPVYEQESSIETNPIQSIPTPKKAGYATSCVKFNVVSEGYSIERALNANEPRRLRNQAARPRNLVDQEEEERKLWPFVLDQTNDDVNSRELRNQVEEATRPRKLQDQLFEGRKLQICSRLRPGRMCWWSETEGNTGESRSAQDQAAEDYKLHNQVVTSRGPRNQIEGEHESRSHAGGEDNLLDQTDETDTQYAGDGEVVRRLCKSTSKTLFKGQCLRRLSSQIEQPRKLRNQVMKGRELRNQVMEGHSGCIRSTPGKMCKQSRKLQEQPPNEGTPQVTITRELRNQGGSRELRNQANDISESALDSNKGLAYFLSKISTMARRKLPTPAPWSSPPPPGPYETASQEHRGLRDRAMDINDARNSIIDSSSIVSRKLGWCYSWRCWFN